MAEEEREEEEPRPHAPSIGAHQLDVGRSSPLLAYGLETGPAASLCLEGAGLPRDRRHNPEADLAPEQEPRRAVPSTTEHVRQYLLASATPLPLLADVARALNLSERSLRRRLHREGSQWRRLLNEVLKFRAEEKLRSGKFNIQQVAEQLGYAEASSFSHAFKRWTGRSPVRYCRDEPQS